MEPVTVPPIRVLEGRTAVVTTAGARFSRDLASGLADAGATVAMLGKVAGEANPSLPAIDCQLDTPDDVEAGLHRATAVLGDIDVIVHARVELAALEPRPLAELDDGGWNVCCEAEIRSALWLCRAAKRHFAQRGGRLFFVTPTLSQSGAAE